MSTEIRLKAAPQWWGDAEQPPAVRRWYEYTIAFVDGVFTLEVDEDRAGEIRAKMIEELPVDDSEKEEAKPVRSARGGEAGRSRDTDVSGSDHGSEGGSAGA